MSDRGRNDAKYLSPRPVAKEEKTNVEVNDAVEVQSDKQIEHDENDE